MSSVVGSLFGIAVASLLLVLLSTVEGAKKKPASEKPNFVIIVADDLGWDDVGFHGSPEVKTPNIDRLAKKGVILNQYYVQPICTPTRSALLTGRYPIRNGMQSSVIMTPQPWALGLEEKLLSQYLQDLDYQTHLVGKWHLGFFSKAHLPLKRGFDSFFGCYSGRGDYWDHSSEAGEFDGLDLRNGDAPVLNEWGNYSTTMFTDVAVDKIMQHTDSDPMFLMVSHLAVHSANSKAPLQAPDEDLQLFTDVKHAGRKTYLAMVSSLDRSVGRIYDALKEKEMLDNTIIIFTTDNGGASKDFDSNQGSNYPLRGMKTHLYEGGVRGAGFVYSPLLKKTDRVSTDLLHVTDWFPTILSLAGGRPDSDTEIDGVDVWRTLSDGAESPREELLLNIDDLVYKNSAYREGKWKVVFQDSSEWTDWFNPPDYDRPAYRKLRTKQQKPASSVECEELPEQPVNCSQGCLFNMEEDPCEYKDLSQENSEKFTELKEKIDEYRNKMAEPKYKHDADPNSNPRNHGGIWTPWIEEDSGNPVEHKPLAEGASIPGRQEAAASTVTANAAPQQQPQNMPTQQRFSSHASGEGDGGKGSERKETFETGSDFIENHLQQTKKANNVQNDVTKNKPLKAVSNEEAYAQISDEASGRGQEDESKHTNHLSQIIDDIDLKQDQRNNL
eukprot:gene18116-19926_t